MLKTSKSVLGFLLVFYMVVISMPCVHAEIIGEFDSLQYKEYADYIEITGCVDSPLRIVIPENIQGKPVKSIGAWAFSDCTELTDISIPDTVTSVGAKAFYGTSCYNDESNWTDGVLYIDNYLIQADSSKITPTYVIKDGTRCIANYAFQECRTLENVIIPGSVAFIGEDAFRDCFLL